VSEPNYEPYESDGVWCWATPMHGPPRCPSHLPYPWFLELPGGEFCEPEGTTDHVVYYPTREAALAALEAARRAAEGVP
jgi:hypothetical protein